MKSSHKLISPLTPYFYVRKSWAFKRLSFYVCIWFHRQEGGPFLFASADLLLHSISLTFSSSSASHHYYIFFPFLDENQQSQTRHFFFPLFHHILLTITASSEQHPTATTLSLFFQFLHLFLIAITLFIFILSNSHTRLINYSTMS